MYIEIHTQSGWKPYLNVKFGKLHTFLIYRIIYQYSFL